METASGKYIAIFQKRIDQVVLLPWLAAIVILVADSLQDVVLWHFRMKATATHMLILNDLFLFVVVFPIVFFLVYRPMRRLLRRYRKALDEVKTLRGFITICCECKKIRVAEQSWEDVESYISSHTEAQFSHGICDDCLRKLYPDQAEGIIEERDSGNHTSAGSEVQPA